jgi:hypothetical protein
MMCCMLSSTSETHKGNEVTTLDLELFAQEARYFQLATP